MAKEFTELDMLEILTGVDNLRHETWPGTGTSEDNPAVPYAIRPLSREDIMQAAARAEAVCKERGIAERVLEKAELPNGVKVEITAFDLANRDEQLAIALRRADNPVRALFRNAQELRIRLTANEVNALYEIVIEHTAKVMPLSVAQFEQRREAVNEVIDALKKDPGSTIADALPRDTLVILVRSMAEQLSR